MKSGMAIFLALLMAAAGTTFSAAEELSTENIQKTIDAAPTGTIVQISAGIYRGIINVKDDIFLVGEGADNTIIDGAGTDVVVRCGKNSALLGLTIRNGKRAVVNGGNFIGVFECVVTNYSEFGILVERGSAVAVNNRVTGNDHATGIAALMANPFIGNNVIANNHIGLLALHEFMPTVTDNIFVDNQIAIQLGEGCKLVLARNVFDRNQVNIRGQKLSETDTIRSVLPGELVPAGGGKVDAYRQLMAVVREKAIALHPLVIYDLGRPTGSFGVAVRFPWATFAITASTKDTKIVQYDAYDRLTDGDLKAQYTLLQGAWPTVNVRNDELTEKGLDRYALDHIYAHPESYFVGQDGRLVFQRRTNISRVKILLPPGQVCREINYPAVYEQNGDLQIVNIAEIGDKNIRMIMEPGTSPSP